MDTTSTFNANSTTDTDMDYVSKVLDTAGRIKGHLPPLRNGRNFPVVQLLNDLELCGVSVWEAAVITLRLKGYSIDWTTAPDILLDSQPDTKPIDPEYYW